ncbi:MAG TPA: c-type cytochrome [Terriglobales bacterium]|nr:c-type cytochrome [Terriglobales bacterium]
MGFRRTTTLMLGASLTLGVALAAHAGAGARAAASETQAGRTEIKNVPAGYTNPTSGRQMFDAYCASCHGQGGKGNGPAARALKNVPADLTQLAARNNGTFPEAHVAQVIRGDMMMVAHGSKEMPIWGPVFLYLEQHDPATAQLRVRNLARYIEGMQQK